MVYSGSEIFHKINANPNTTQRLDLAQQASERLVDIHHNIATSLAEAQSSLKSFWKGESSDTASAGLSPVIQTSNVAADHLDLMQLSMNSVNSKFHSTKDEVVPVADSRPDDNGIDDWLSIGASDDEKNAAKFDADTAKNREVYESYYQMATGVYGPEVTKVFPAAHDPNVSAGSITPDQTSSGTSGDTHSSGGSGGHSSGYSGGYMPGPSSYSAPPGAAGYQAPPPPSHAPAVSAPAVNTPAANDTTSAAFAGPTQAPNGPGTAPWQGPGATGGNGTGGGFTPGFGPMGGFGPGGSGGGGFGPGGSRFGGGGGGFGPGGGGSRGGSGGASSGGAAGFGRGVGAGAGSGAGAVGEGGGAGTTRPGGMGAPGAKGQPGMGGMGAGARGGGKGTEDEEHQRKILLSEEDPDSIFGGYDGNKPTPPVIGA